MAKNSQDSGETGFPDKLGEVRGAAQAGVCVSGIPVFIERGMSKAEDH